MKTLSILITVPHLIFLRIKYFSEKFVVKIQENFVQKQLFRKSCRLIQYEQIG
jgi:hypothetical protein